MRQTSFRELRMLMTCMYLRDESRQGSLPQSQAYGMGKTLELSHQHSSNTFSIFATQTTKAPVDTIWQCSGDTLPPVSGD